MTNRLTLLTVCLGASTLLSACQPAADNTPASVAAAELSGQQQFMASFQPFCGQAFAATIVEDNAPSPDWDHPLVVHVRDCEENVVRMPLHVGDDHSRTWELTLHDDYIDFQHYHRYPDGKLDATSPYGGRTLDSGTATAQSFPVDEGSKGRFIANGLDVSTTNTWSIRFIDATTMAYQLSRPGRLFEVHVDLSAPIELPPPAWGYQGN